MNILVVGAGSIGKRHIKNLMQNLDVNQIFVVEPREDRRNEVENLGIISSHIFENKESSVNSGSFQGAIVATPTSMHYEDALYLVNHHISLMIEKPLGIDASLAHELEEQAKKNNVFIFTAYCFRFDPVAHQFDQYLKNKIIGEVLYARAEMSTYLPEWHPHEDYRHFYMAKKDLGGGTLLDQSHLYDMALWFFGDVDSVFGMSQKYSSLEIETDDFGEFIFKMKSGLYVSIHIDLFTRPWREFFMVTGTLGTITWDIHHKKIILEKANEDKKILMEGKDYNQMYVNEIKYFLSQVKDKGKNEGPRYFDGKRVVEIIDALRLSSQKNRVAEIA